MAGGGSPGGLAVLGTPGLLAPESLPGHRILTFTLCNAGPADVVLEAGEIALRDPADAPLRATVTFDRESAGPRAVVRPKEAALAPGGTVGVVVAWHGGPAARLEHPGGALELEPAPTSAPRA